MYIYRLHGPERKYCAKDYLFVGYYVYRYGTLLKRQKYGTATDLYCTSTHTSNCQLGTVKKIQKKYKKNVKIENYSENNVSWGEKSEHFWFNF